jgi:hypothetical protein
MDILHSIDRSAIDLLHSISNQQSPISISSRCTVSKIADFRLLIADLGQHRSFGNGHSSFNRSFGNRPSSFNQQSAIANQHFFSVHRIENC